MGKNNIFTLLLAIFISSTVVFANDGDTTKTKTNFELKPDDPVLMMIDNAMLSKYFESFIFVFWLWWYGFRFRGWISRS